MKTVIITGIEGQDGSIMAKLLLSKGYKVVGLKRRSSLIKTDRIDEIYKNPNFLLEYFDLNDVGSLYRYISVYQPDEFYNFAAQSHVKTSFDIPQHTIDGIVMGTTHILEAIRNIRPETKFYQASSSEMFGVAECPPGGYTETSLMLPASPYAVAKLAAHHLVRVYRESYGLFACSGILFNHEGAGLRGETFVTRKITQGVARIKLGLQEKLVLGNIHAYRDWGSAFDYMNACYLMLQQDEPDDFVICTGETHTVSEFLDIVCKEADIDKEKILEIDKKYYRPYEVPYLLGNSIKAMEQLKWVPITTFEDLAKEMYQVDLQMCKKEQVLKKNGYEVRLDSV